MDEMGDDEPQAGWVFWLTAALGAAIVVYGVSGLLENEPRGAASATRWFIGGALVLDLVVVPVGAVLGLLARRVVPSWSWPVVRAALFTAVVLTAVALPLVLDQGGVPSNPTVRPRNYAVGLTIALLATAAAAAVALAVRHRHRHEHSHRDVV